MFVLDTNVVSELMKKSPHQNVSAWVNSRHAGELYTTAITVAEVLYGIRRLPHGSRRDLLETTARAVFGSFQSHIWAFDANAATIYAEIVANRERAGPPISGFDAQIGAICRSHAAALATRNVDDFQGIDLEIVDPWTS